MSIVSDSCLPLWAAIEWKKQQYTINAMWDFAPARSGIYKQAGACGQARAGVKNYYDISCDRLREVK